MNPDNNNNTNGYGVSDGTTSGAPNFETYDPVPENSGAGATYADPNQSYANSAQGYADPSQAYNNGAYAQDASAYTQDAGGVAYPQNADGSTYAQGADATAYAQTADASAQPGAYDATQATYDATQTAGAYDATQAAYADPNTQTYADPNAQPAYPDPSGGMTDPNAAPVQPADTTNNFSSYTSDNIATSTAATTPAAPAANKKKSGGKKKVSLPVIIALVAVLVVLLVVGIILLIPMLTSGSGTTNNNSVTVVTPVVEETSAETILTCNMSSDSYMLAAYGDALSATQNLEVSYDGDALKSITYGVAATYADDAKAALGFDAIRKVWNSSLLSANFATDPVTSTYSQSGPEATATHTATAAQLTPQVAGLFYLNTTSDGAVDSALDSIRTVYENGGYACTTNE